jgi:hypothetical protein
MDCASKIACVIPSWYAPHAAARLKSKPVHAGSMLMFLAIAWLSGCTDVAVKSGLQEGVPGGQSFSRVLVVGVSPNYDLRCAFESDLASELRSNATQAIPSCDKMKAEERLTRENIERVVASVQADAVLVTSLVAADASASEGNSRDTRGDAGYKVTGVGTGYGFGEYGMPVKYAEFETAPPVTTVKSSFHVLTKLYETRGATLVYTIDTKSKPFEVESTQDSIIRITTPTADRLRRDGLIR